MKRASSLLFSVLLAVGFVGHAAAQQPTHPTPAMPGMQAQPRGSMGMCGGGDSGMTCPMMKRGASSGMQGGAMPMMGGDCGAEETPATSMTGGPAESPRMVQLRGEMLKAMGEVMTKYGKMMESAGR